jgi:hypothetical protein
MLEQPRAFRKPENTPGAANQALIVEAEYKLP